MLLKAKKVPGYVFSPSTIIVYFTVEEFTIFYVNRSYMNADI